MKKVFLVLLGTLLIYTSSNLSTIAFANEDPMISVKLKNYIGSQTQLTVKVKGEYTISGSDFSLLEGKTYTVKAENNALTLYENGILKSTFTSLTMVPKIYGTNNSIMINDRPYLGSMNFVIENNTYVRPINTLPLEDYLKGVVPFEMMASWNKEALKAQAVAARTYAVRYQSSMMDDTVNYQAYGGYTWNSSSTAAVEETNSQYLTYNGKTIDAFYSASNGGMTESNANVWGGTPLPMFPIKQDPYDTKVPWGFTFKKTQMDTTTLDLANPQNWWNSVKEMDSSFMTNIKNWMVQNGYANDEIKIISIPAFSFSNDKTSGNRVKYGNISIQFFLKDKTSGQFVMDNGQIKVNTLSYVNTSASRIRAMVGINNMKSYLVSNFIENDSSYTVNGLGNGHGVGMSQWGAKVMADQGRSYQEILSFYFPGTTLANAAPPGSTTTSPSINSTDANGTSTTDTTIVTTAPVMDKVAPSISNVSSAYTEQSNQISVNFNVNEASTMTVYVKNSQGTILSYLLQNNPQNAGNFHLTYDVSKVPNGVYSFGIITIDSSNNRSSYLQNVTVNKAAAAPGNNTGSTVPTVSTASLPSKGYMDAPVVGTTLKGNTPIKGWFLDGSGVAKIQVLADGKVIGTAQYGSSRTDVQKAFPQYQNANSGFQYTLNTNTLSNGQHTLTVRETGKNGKITDLTRKVNVQNLPAKGYIDSPAEGTSIKGSTIVKGWFLDGNGVSKIEVLVDGKSIGTAQYGSSRTDVQKAFPQYQNANSGYQYTLNTRILSNGQHLLTVRETGKNGTATVLATRKINVRN
ncbi:SpoIID/LytB domain-containing protein [Neobacillus drentensis]|uniref:SpoIID/LytB domain-containing protein n=1 Tax=Neobacillus drentensis TaxID=220684 RepID=UPI002FFE61F8